ncbi:MAG: pyridoxamine 5'-phosphate oxidase family protein [Desulfobacteraceae bacterium]|jgi:general stress protein 26
MSAKETVAEVLKGHNVVRIATLDSAGMPCVRSVDYAQGDGENVLYFITRKDSRKAEQLKNNGNVAFAVDHDCPTWEDLQKLKYIKGTAVANLIQDPQEMQKAFGLLMQKLPFLKDIPGDPSDFVSVKVELKEVLVTDNTIEFEHTETVNY